LRFSLFIALRYLFSKKSTNVINIISGISISGIVVGTCALVILLSAFNGLEDWVVRLYNSFDPDIHIESKNSKFFKEDAISFDKLMQIEGVAYVMPVIEENGLLHYRDAQYVCTIKGVGEEFKKMSGLDSMIINGSFDLHMGSSSAALVGSGVSYALSLSLGDINEPINIYVPKANASFSLNPIEAFHSGSIHPSGIFEVQPEFDTRFIIVPIDFARELFHREKTVSSIEIQLKKEVDVEQVIDKIKSITGESFVIKNRFQQHELLYKIIHAEKWGVFLILAFILLIAIFNVTGSLTMLIVDKSRDIRTLQSLGANWKTIRMIFFMEGLLISVIGMLTGLLLGLLIVILQDKFQFVLINGVDAYPVLIKKLDIVYISITVLTIGAIAAWFPAARALSKRKLLSS
jgi:lipoprotein-releasing system permease protein